MAAGGGGPLQRGPPGLHLLRPAAQRQLAVALQWRGEAVRVHQRREAAAGTGGRRAGVAVGERDLGARQPLPGSHDTPRGGVNCQSYRGLIG